jgi:hypothetical protein
VGQKWATHGKEEAGGERENWPMANIGNTILYNFQNIFSKLQTNMNSIQI